MTVRTPALAIAVPMLLLEARRLQRLASADVIVIDSLAPSTSPVPQDPNPFLPVPPLVLPTGTPSIPLTPRGQGYQSVGRSRGRSWRSIERERLPKAMDARKRTKEAR